MKRKYQPPQDRLAGSLAISAFLYIALFFACGFTSRAYWDGISFRIALDNNKLSIIEQCKALEVIVPYKSHSCSNCNAPIFEEQFDIPDDFYKTPRFFGLLSLNTNFGVPLLMNGNRAVVDDCLLRNYNYGDVAIDGVFVPKAVYDSWLEGNINTENVAQTSMSSPIRYTGTNVYGPSYGENIEEESPTGYLFAVIVPNLPVTITKRDLDFYYVLIRVKKGIEVTYLNDPTDHQSPYYYFRNERDKFKVYIVHHANLYDREIWTGREKGKYSGSAEQRQGIFVIAGVLLAMSIQLVVFLIWQRKGIKKAR